MGIFDKFKKKKAKKPAQDAARIESQHADSVAMFTATQPGYVVPMIDEQREEAERNLDEDAVNEVSEPTPVETPQIDTTPSVENYQASSTDTSTSYSDTSSASVSYDSGSSSSYDSGSSYSSDSSSSYSDSGSY